MKYNYRYSLLEEKWKENQSPKNKWFYLGGEAQRNRYMTLIIGL